MSKEYQDGENSYCEFFGLVPFLQLAIQSRIEKALSPLSLALEAPKVSLPQSPPQTQATSLSLSYYRVFHLKRNPNYYT
jgi:hypothetical protein